MVRAPLRRPDLLPERLRRLRLPVGRVARHRRLLRRVLADAPVGRVLVVGPWRAALQAFTSSRVDVAGTSPHTEQITVCSTVEVPGSLPSRRWDTVILSGSTNAADRMLAVLPACRPGARVVLVEAASQSQAGLSDDVVPAASCRSTTTRRDRLRVWRLP